jgi:hypothetical protein
MTDSFSPGPDQTANWTEHEHIVPPIQSQAQRLLAEAGSPELAKHALDMAAAGPSTDAGHIDGLAQRWGFRPRHDLLAASISIATSSRHMWWLTPIDDRGWVAWTERDSAMSDMLPTLEQARQFVTNR